MTIFKIFLKDFLEALERVKIPQQNSILETYKYKQKTLTHTQIHMA